jgi:DNA topoisomerase VI subunit B
VTAAARRLVRETFTTSRLLEFCSRKELISQTGHGVEQWPLVIIKEAIDNALDDAEETGVEPHLAIAVRGGRRTGRGKSLAREELIRVSPPYL